MSQDAKFYKQLILLSAIVTLLTSAFHFFIIKLDIFHWLGLVYFIALTAVSYFLISKGIKSQDVDFVSYFMGASAIRLLLSALILFLYFYFVKKNAVSFTASFFIFYLCFTVFEIRTLLANLRPNFDRDGTIDTVKAKQKNEP